MADRSPPRFPRPGWAGTGDGQQLIYPTWRAVSRRSRPFERRNSGRASISDLAIQAKNAILIEKDSLAAQIPTLQGSAPNRRQSRNMGRARGGVAEVAELGSGGAACGKRPSGHRMESEWLTDGARKGNLHGLNAIVRVRASGAMRSAHSSDAKA